jgi:hypothetical protein
MSTLGVNFLVSDGWSRLTWPVQTIDAISQRCFASARPLRNLAAHSVAERSPDGKAPHRDQLMR